MTTTNTTDITPDVEWVEEWIWDDLRMAMEGNGKSMEEIVIDVTDAAYLLAELPLGLTSVAWRHKDYKATLAAFRWVKGKALATYAVDEI
jgi:hypothetical protein